ncbi:MAG: methionyl-tRNA formyltransferase [Thermoleophilia bacterium]
MKIAFAGTPKFGALVLGALLGSRHEVALVFTQPDRPAGRGLGLKMSPVKELALKESLRVEQPEKISTPEWVGEMKSLGVKVLTVAAFGQILRAPLLGGIPCINVHASRLPKYRGAAPIERAIMAGERNTGVTIMDITPALDTGPIYLQRVVPITEEDDAGSIYEKLGRTGGEALAEVLDAIEAGGMEPEPQDESAATYIEKITAADMEISFKRPAWKIAAQVRALSPHIGAFIKVGGLRLKVWKVMVAESAPACAATAAPGEFVIEGERLFAVCGTGILELVEVQPQGKRHMSAAEFLRGYRKTIEAA